MSQSNRVTELHVGELIVDYNFSAVYFFSYYKYYHKSVVKQLAYNILSNLPRHNPGKIKLRPFPDDSIPVSEGVLPQTSRSFFKADS